MDTELIEKINNIEEKSKYYNNEDNMYILEQKYIPVQMIDNEQMYYLPTMEEMSGNIQNKLKEIREQNSRALTDNTYDNNIIDEPQYIRGMTYSEPILVRGMTYENI